MAILAMLLDNEFSYWRLARTGFLLLSFPFNELGDGITNPHDLMQILLPFGLLLNGRFRAETVLRMIIDFIITLSDK